jgi:hypothetical protein
METNNNINSFSFGDRVNMGKSSTFSSSNSKQEQNPNPNPNPNPKNIDIKILSKINLRNLELRQKSENVLKFNKNITDTTSESLDKSSGGKSPNKIEREKKINNINITSSKCRANYKFLAIIEPKNETKKFFNVQVRLNLANYLSKFKLKDKKKINAICDTDKLSSIIHFLNFEILNLWNSGQLTREIFKGFIVKNCVKIANDFQNKYYEIFQLVDRKIAVQKSKVKNSKN